MAYAYVSLSAWPLCEFLIVSCTLAEIRQNGQMSIARVLLIESSHRKEAMHPTAYR